jgi:hypothetical protein
VPEPLDRCAHGNLLSSKSLLLVTWYHGFAEVHKGISAKTGLSRDRNSDRE